MLLPELKKRRDKIRAAMVARNIDAALIACNVNLIYTHGSVISGYLYLALTEPARIFVKRPNNISGEFIYPIRKPEQIPDILTGEKVALPQRLMLEGDELSWSDFNRLAAVFPDAEIVNGTPVIREARATKTEYEIEMFRRAGMAHAKAYSEIPAIYKPGMTDYEFSVEIERVMRLNGCLGIFRIFGQSMEIYMGSLLSGENASEPSPYDFALGGKGMNPSLPIGANGSPLKEGQTVMVDFGGNFNGYMSDMSRVFSIGQPSDEVLKAHQACLDVQNAVVAAAKPGVTGEELYTIGMGVIQQTPYVDYFMGAGQKAGFIGHGIGLEINELPVLAPRQRQELEPGMVFALEPKVVLPGTGPVGVENSWVVTNNGVECLTNGPEEIIVL